MRESDQLLPAVRVAEIANEEHAERWLVKSLWGDSSVSVIGAAPKCSTTWLGLDMALSVATGTPWLVKYAVPQPGPALVPALVYLAKDALPIVPPKARHRPAPAEKAGQNRGACTTSDPRDSNSRGIPIDYLERQSINYRGCQRRKSSTFPGAGFSWSARRSSGRQHHPNFSSSLLNLRLESPSIRTGRTSRRPLPHTISAPLSPSRKRTKCGVPSRGAIRGHLMTSRHPTATIAVRRNTLRRRNVGRKWILRMAQCVPKTAKIIRPILGTHGESVKASRHIKTVTVLLTKIALIRWRRELCIGIIKLLSTLVKATAFRGPSPNPSWYSANYRLNAVVTADVITGAGTRIIARVPLGLAKIPQGQVETLLPARAVSEPKKTPLVKGSTLWYARRNYVGRNWN